MMTIIQKHCLELHKAYKDGLLGNQEMPEDTHPIFTTKEEKLSFYTLPMSLNYQRNSYTLWQAAKRSFEDPQTNTIFSIMDAARLSQNELRPLLLKNKIALQPNKHTDTWHRIATIVANEWGSLEAMLKSVDNDFLRLQELIQITHK